MSALPIGLAMGIAIGAGGAVIVKDDQIAAIQRDQAVQARRITDEQVSRLQAAQARGDGLTSDLLAARASADQLQEQLHDALHKTTSGRACLGGGALRVLDRAALGVRADLPPPAGGAAAADAGESATDTEVAQWASAAYHEYAECARRLDALIQFNEASSE